MSESAMMHYRVEIQGAEEPATAPKASWVSSTLRRPDRRRPTSVHVFDRTGAEVLTLSFPDTAAGSSAHDRIVDDLIALDVETFREKYKIAAPLPGPGAVPAPAAAGAVQPPANVAGASYRVERVGAGNVRVDVNPFAKRILDFISPGALDEQIQEAVQHTSIPEPALPEGWAPAAEPLHATLGSLIRIVSRDGRVVFTREDSDPAQIDAIQAELTRDLGSLEPAAFESKYGIAR